MQRIDNDVEGELMFALKMLMGTVDQLVTRDDAPPKNRKEILQRLFNRALRSAFHRWKEEVKVEESPEAAAGESGGGGVGGAEEVLRRMEKAQEMNAGMHEACMTEIRSLGEQVEREREREREKACTTQVW